MNLDAFLISEMNLDSFFVSEEEEAVFERGVDVLEEAVAKGAFFPGKRGDVARIVQVVQEPLPVLPRKEALELIAKRLEWNRAGPHFSVFRSWGVYSPYSRVAFKNVDYCSNTFVDKTLVGKTKIQLCTLLTLSGFRPFRFDGEDIFIQQD
jgi:hypothetical protein